MARAASQKRLTEQQAKAALEASRAEAARLQERAIELREQQEYEAAAAAAAAATAAEAAAAAFAAEAEAAVGVAAAGTLQRWWRGTLVRRTLSAVLLERRMASLSAERRRQVRGFDGAKAFSFRWGEGGVDFFFYDVGCR